MNNDLISIIVPVYNKNKQLTKCIESILEQSYGNIELILVDDGSTDGSQIICDEFSLKDQRVEVYHIPNGGVGNARNLGINIAKGSFIQFVDADDYIDERMIESLVTLCKNTDSDMGVCGYKQIVNGQTVGKVYPPDIKHIDKADYFKLIDVYHLDPLCGSPCNRIISASLIKRRGILFNKKATFAEDFMFVIDVLSSCNHVSSLEECYYNYNLDVNNSLSKVTKARNDDAWQQEQEFIGYFKRYMENNSLIPLFPYLTDEIYFGLVSTSLISRVKSGEKRKDICEWLMQNTIEKDGFDIKRISIKNKRVNEDVNARKRRLGILFQKTLRMAIKFHLQNMYVYLLELMIKR